MPDISMCEGKDCPVKSDCRRFYSKPSERQTYFLDPPYTIKDKLFNCEYYWDKEGIQGVIHVLK